MGSGEEDDMAEEAQEDSSPIELDWSHLRTKITSKQQRKKTVCVPSLHLRDNGGQRCWSCAFRGGGLFPKKTPQKNKQTNIPPTSPIHLIYN